MLVRNAFIFHGIYGHPGENWYPWMQRELEKLGFVVCIPHFPTIEPVTPLKAWQDVYAEIDDQINSESILIGHSLGAAAALNILEKHTVRAAFLIAPAVLKTDNEFTTVMHEIADQNFDFETIRKHCRSIEIWHADNDPYLPLTVAQTLAAHLKIEVTLVSGAGHMNSNAGYTEFPKLLEQVVACEESMSS